MPLTGDTVVLLRTSCSIDSQASIEKDAPTTLKSILALLISSFPLRHKTKTENMLFEHPQGCEFPQDSWVLWDDFSLAFKRGLWISEIQPKFQN